MDMPQLWILMDNSSRVTHRPYNCLDNLKNEVAHIPTASTTNDLYFKEKSIKNRDTTTLYIYHIFQGI